jgi:hypothetical protein
LPLLPHRRRLLLRLIADLSLRLCAMLPPGSAYLVWSILLNISPCWQPRWAARGQSGEWERSSRKKCAIFGGVGDEVGKTCPLT